MTIAIITIVAFIAVLALAKHSRKKNKRQTIEVDKDLCVGCGHCVKQCRKHVLSMTNTEGKAHAEMTASERCTACGRCMMACPMRAIRLKEKE